MSAAVTGGFWTLRDASSPSCCPSETGRNLLRCVMDVFVTRETPSDSLHRDDLAVCPNSVLVSRLLLEPRGIWHQKHLMMENNRSWEEKIVRSCRYFRFKADTRIIPGKSRKPNRPNRSKHQAYKPFWLPAAVGHLFAAWRSPLAIPCVPVHRLLPL